MSHFISRGRSTFSIYIGSHLVAVWEGPDGCEKEAIQNELQVLSSESGEFA
jgi:hypothetical protein